MAQRPSSGVTSSREIALYEGQKRALAQLLSGMDDDARWVLLVGLEGSGKTTILQALRTEIGSTDADVVVCDGLEVVEPEELFIALRGRLVLPAPGRGGLAEAITASRRSHTNPLALLIDNAHELSPSNLKLLAEVVRKTDAKAGGAWVVLAGPPSLEAPALRAGGELKHVQCSPLPLTAAEAASHVDRRMRAGPGSSLRISPDAVQEIARCTGGFPGRINALCDLVVARPSVRLSDEVSVEVVEEAADRLGFDPSSEPSYRRRWDAVSQERARSRARWRRRVGVFVLILVAIASGTLGFFYGLPLAQKGRDWVTARLFPPEPPRAATPSESPGRPRASRREPAGAATPSARSTAVRAGGERRSGTDQVQAAARVERAPRPVSAEQIAALIEGARAGRPDDVARLLGDGVPPEVRDAGGVTALMHAVLRGHVEAARVLLDKGAQVNARDRGGITSSMLAVINERPDALKLLLERGADVNARSGSGWTALTFAAWKGDPDLVRTLLKHGANRNVVDKQGWTPLDYATANLQSPPSDSDASDSPPPQGGRHSEVVPLLQGATRP
jgi:type II secretory pathway predicted ATPase ExeA